MSLPDIGHKYGCMTINCHGCGTDWYSTDYSGKRAKEHDIVKERRSALLPWVETLPFMQQSVLISAVRAPDGLRKDHPVKVIMRWYRRCVLISAFNRREMLTPFEIGGGSFTGPFTLNHAVSMGISPHDFHGDMWVGFDRTREVYLRYVDEMPHHFQLHLMHAAEIIGYNCPNEDKRVWWRTFYFMIVNDAHLHPETADEMNKRLSDYEDHWRAREEVTAK